MKKIKNIIQKHFNVEIQYKEAEVKLIDQVGFVVFLSPSEIIFIGTSGGCSADEVC